MISSRTLQKMGANIKNARLKANLTQIEVAHRADISVNHYARIERGEINLLLATLEAILKVLNARSSTILSF